VLHWGTGWAAMVDGKMSKANTKNVGYMAWVGFMYNYLFFGGYIIGIIIGVVCCPQTKNCCKTIKILLLIMNCGLVGASLFCLSLGVVF
jgi:hypothetical protein